ncbi:hypothetical protein ACWF0M_27135 [Kribbella sp. NPDC055110]
MTLLLLAALAVGAGLVVRRWWLLIIPPAMVAGGLLLLAMPGSSIDPDNPLLFVALLLELSLGAGLLTARSVLARRAA